MLSLRQASHVSALKALLGMHRAVDADSTEDIALLGLAEFATSLTSASVDLVKLGDGTDDYNGMAKSDKDCQKIDALSRALQRNPLQKAPDSVSSTTMYQTLKEYVDEAMGVFLRVFGWAR